MLNWFKLLKMLLFFYLTFSASASQKARDLADQVIATVNTKSGWEEGFLNFAGLVASNVDLCENLQKCANSMKIADE